MALTTIKTEEPDLLTPEDLRQEMNISKFRSGLRHVVGSALVGLTSAAATIGLFWTSWNSGQTEAAFFAGFTAINTYWMIAYCRAACSTLTDDYQRAISRADEANRQNAILRKQNLRLVTERRLREEGTDGDGGKNITHSPSANFRFIPHKGRVQ